MNKINWLIYSKKG